MSEVFFFSDPHLGHEKISDNRGFRSVAAHDYWVMETLYSLPRGSHLWGLGDLTGGRRTEEDEALSKMYELSRDRGLHIHWVAGNHDAIHAHHSTAQNHQRRYNVVFDSVHPLFREHRIGSKRVLMSHLPYDGDSGPVERYLQQRPRDLGMPIIHGHTHSAEKITYSAEGTLQAHVGLDAWKRPVALTEVLDILRTNRHQEAS